MDKIWSQILLASFKLIECARATYVLMITSFIIDEILRIISCLIKRMRVQLIPGPSLFHRREKSGPGYEVNKNLKNFFLTL